MTPELQCNHGRDLSMTSMESQFKKPVSSSASLHEWKNICQNQSSHFLHVKSHWMLKGNKINGSGKSSWRNTIEITYPPDGLEYIDAQKIRMVSSSYSQMCGWNCRFFCLGIKSPKTRFNQHLPKTSPTFRTMILEGKKRSKFF